MLATRPAPEVVPRGEHRSVPVAGEVEDEGGVGAGGVSVEVAPVVEEPDVETVPPGARQVLLGDDLVGVDVDQRERHREPGVYLERFHAPLRSLNSADRPQDAAAAPYFMSM